MLQGMRVVDLTIPLGPDIIMWPGAPEPTFENLTSIKNDGYFARIVSFFEHTGTHFDAPSHFIEGHNTVDKFPAEKLVRPAVVIDISARIGDDADGELILADVQAFESAHGEIPREAAILLRTGWERFNNDVRKYAGEPGKTRFPGFGAEAARFLVEERDAVGLGTDTLGIDPGYATDYPVHSTISHPKGLWHLENLTNLSQLPPLGAWVVVGVLPLVDGSGSPARVIALLP